MSLTRFALRPDYRDTLAGMFPRLTSEQLQAFIALAETDQLVTDNGTHHPALAAWVENIKEGRE